MGKDKKRNRKKPPKQKPRYYDDGSTVADMSGLSPKPRLFLPQNRPGKKPGREPRTRGGQIWQTYIAAVRMMLKPMFITLGIICALFLILWFLF